MPRKKNTMLTYQQALHHAKELLASSSPEAAVTLALLKAWNEGYQQCCSATSAALLAHNNQETDKQ